MIIEHSTNVDKSFTAVCNAMFNSSVRAAIGGAVGGALGFVFGAGVGLVPGVNYVGH